MKKKNLTMSFGTQVLFENVNLNIPEKEDLELMIDFKDEDDIVYVYDFKGDK